MANVLLAEDDGDVATALGLALSAAGHRVRRAADGVQAIEVVRRDEVDVAVLDLLLPRKGGLEVAAAIREGSGVPIVLVTGIYRGASRRE